MTMSAKIRRYLAKGTSIAEIAKRLGVSKNNVWTVIWKEKQKAKAAKPEATPEEKRKPGRPKKLVFMPKHLDKALKLLDEQSKKQEKWMDITYPGEAFIPNSVSADLVNHPPHYKAGGIEVIDFIEAKDLNFRLANVVKYVSRAGKKDSDPVQDLEKAAWYLKREIDARKRA